MECNKEEALRAKDIAEKKMLNKDFNGARKIALKAQQLYPDLENITQMLIVCDVHCSAEQRLFGNEMDWYKILQIELTANDTTIKKQYRKFALQLHPDKNKFAGAEAAFKLIGEAQRVLLDREKRSRLDMNLRRVPMNRTTMPSHHHQNVKMNFNPVMQTSVRPNFTNLNPQQQQQTRQPSQQGPNGGRPTFWTVCSFCSVRYEYYREVLNRSLRCQNCSRPFIAYDVDVQGTTPATNSSQQAFGAQNYSQNHGAFKVGVGSQGNLHPHRSNTESYQKKSPTADVSVKPNGKRRRKRVRESSESSESVGSTDSESEEDMLYDKDGFPGVSTHREENPRRSTRQKHQVSYKENVSDDDEGNGSPSGVGENRGEAAKMNEQNGLGADLKGDQQGVKKKQNFYSEENLQNINEEINEVRGKEAVGSSKIDKASEHSTSKSTDQPDNFVYPDAEFSDFDKDKKEGSFAAGQIWAIYDTTDGMPRFYALIRKVLSPGFKLRITWFEPDPDEYDEVHWLNEQLPVACGKHKLGSTETTEDRLMFSHLIFCEKIGRSSYKVYPRKGETWALFKNWDIKWHMDAESHRQYDFEFVEILSDYVEGVGVVVAYLAKLKGFVSLFSRMEGGNRTFQIPSVELFRFSHRVPSFKMTGQERVGVPVGSYELDPVSLPMILEEIAVPEDLGVKVGHCPYSGMGTRSADMSKFMMNSEGDASTAKVNLESSNSAEENKDPVDHIGNGSAQSASAADAFEIPDPVFCNFDAGRSLEKFQIGQIWAFYGDEDGLPKYYGQVKRVRTSPDLELQVTYLTNCWLPENSLRWEDKDMLISIGRFKIKTGARPCIYTNTYSVSHQVQAITDGGKKKEYEIFPRKGEIWALYKNWTTKIKRSDLENWEYDIVEVIGENDLWMDVLPLELVSGYNSVFKGKSNEGSARTMKIYWKELLRFSHQIPAFKLTEKHGGNLRGFWELDPGALPLHYFNNK
ncbi:DnaJ-like subfamily B member 12 [Spatholobus suberectus]|nr:DnaJ-like subfamily B member 12 [Spatholobus suberectus]